MMKEFIKNNSELILALGLIFFGVLSRTTFHIQNNVEFVTAFSLASIYFFKNKSLAIATTLGILFLSDLIIGNSSIFIFTWSGFILGAVAFKFVSNNKLNLFATATLGAILSTAIFFLWTNFGVVALTTMYTKDLAGLVQSYINGIPFVVNQLIGNLIIVPAVFIAFNLIYKQSDIEDLQKIKQS